MALMDKYRDRGMKLTPQRLAIFRYLEGNKDHPSAEEIFRAVSRKFPTMSFATVYNTMAALRDKGRVRELTLDPGKKRYDPDTAQHNHLICDGCAKVVDVPVAFDLRLPPGAKNDFTVTSNHVEFHGLCPQCKNKDKR